MPVALCLSGGLVRIRSGSNCIERHVGVLSDSPLSESKNINRTRVFGSDGIYLLH